MYTICEAIYTFFGCGEWIKGYLIKINKKKLKN